MQRRSWLQRSGALALGSLSAGVWPAAGAADKVDMPAGGAALPAKTRVLVVGGGFGGATAAKYLRLLSGYALEVVLVEPDAAFVSCPLSNLVLGGTRQMADVTQSYERLHSHHGVRVVRDRVAAIDARGKTATLATGPVLRYDKLVLSPGVEMIWDSVAGSRAAQASGQVLQAWQAGPETAALRRQLEAMPDGGVFAITIPEVPYRCPPGPYERACVVADYFRRTKPRAKLLVLDANEDVTSKGALFKQVWAERYAGIIEYRPQHKAVAVDGKTRTVQFEFQDDVRADVLNVLPSMRAGAIAVQTGLANSNGRWVNVHFLNFESTAAKDIHVLGDAIQVAPAMPKSGHMANNQAKVAAAAIVAELRGWEINPAPVLTNTCYSFVDAARAIHVASVHAYDAAGETFQPVHGAGGLSPGPSSREAVYAWNWAQTTWADTLG